MPTRPLMQKGEARHAPSHAFSSRHFLKLIEDTGEVGFWSADMRTDRLEASVGLYQILGLDPSQEMTFGFGLDMIHPEDRAAHGDQITVLRSGQPIAREFRIIRPDRTKRWILHRAEVVLGSDGKPIQGMGVVFDVTARHDSVRSMEQRHDRFNALLSATAAVFWINGPDGEPLEMPQWQALTGQSHAQMSGQGWLEAIHPDDRHRTAAAWMTAVSHTTPYNTDYRILCADGVYRWFNARGVPILNRDGSVREWVGVCLSVPGQNRYGSSKSCAAGAPSIPDIEQQILTPAQIRGARGITGLSKDELARRANVSVSTIVRLEDGASGVRPRIDTVLAVRQALEQAGIEFTFEPNGKPGLREV
ncbi:PAS domain-containing protein [Methylobacterium sp. J-077]|uniref:PAS domain-containing protein n=1 Tax=Methylobacterium sp. J-077 TaxID=2836656 RepID=UPI001FBAA4E6|nr:PAS domain-containing protein [Methylobacterium sp. J-077]MCJ2124145.1 PAS domain-containing protein [Methylobacterium sp. J-077]